MSQTKAQLVSGTTAQDLTVDNINTTSINSGQTSGTKNLIINGAMQVAQRGTSFADPATGSYTVDRFSMRNNSGTPAFTFSQDSDAPHGFNNSLKVACTTADASPASGSISRITYKIEAQDLQPLAKGTSSAKASTLSFYVKTNKTGLYTVFVYDDDNNRMFSTSYTVSDTNWNRYTINIPADTTGAINDDNGTGFVINWGLSLGSNRTSGSLASTWATYATANEHVGNVNFADNTSNVWAITGVQLEVGSVATDFEHRSFAQELALCQRYFHKIESGSTDVYLNTLQAYGSGAVFGVYYHFPVTMRATPTTTVTGTITPTNSAGNFAGNLSSFTFDRNTPDLCASNNTSGGSGLSGGDATLIALRANTSASISSSAEL